MLTDEDKQWIKDQCQRLIDDAFNLHRLEEQAARDRRTDEKIRQLVDQIDAWHKPE